MSKANGKIETFHTANGIPRLSYILTYIHIMSNCPICFEDITSKTGHATLACGHTYHMRCISQWFQTATEPACACCRKSATHTDWSPIVQNPAPINPSRRRMDFLDIFFYIGILLCVLFCLFTNPYRNAKMMLWISQWLVDSSTIMTCQLAYPSLQSHVS